MNSITSNIQELKAQLPQNVRLIAVSKTKPIASIQEAYNAGQREFGENYVQELTEKKDQLPSDIVWHFIGHLQSNKVKYIAEFVDWIHGVESEKLLVEINKQAAKHNRIINCLLQVHIGQEETKFGFDQEELIEYCKHLDLTKFPNIKLCGLMGMASFTEDQEQIRQEFKNLNSVFIRLKSDYFVNNPFFCDISMGMSSDWKIAIEEGSTMIRVGSSIFGSR